MDRVASQSLLARRPPKMRGFLVASIVGHVLVMAATVIYARYGSDRALVDLDQKPIKATLVRKGKERDQQLLPRKEELPPPPQKQEEVQAPAPTPEPKVPEKAAVPLPIPDLKPAPTQKAEKQKGEDKGDRSKQLFSAFDKASKKSKPEELEGAADGDELGDSAIQEGERYFGLLKAQVTRNFDLPQTIPEDERISLKTLVNIRVSRSGELIDARITKASHNSLYDNAVLSALKRAQPFSPPPDHLRDQLQKRGITMEFTP